MNYVIRLTENRENGHIALIKCSMKKLKKIQHMSVKKGFLAFNVSILDTTIKQPSKRDNKAFNNFLENIKY